MIHMYNLTSELQCIVYKGKNYKVAPSDRETGVIGQAEISEKGAAWCIQQRPGVFTTNFVEAKGDSHLFDSPFDRENLDMIPQLSRQEVIGVIKFLSKGVINGEMLKDQADDDLYPYASELATGFFPNAFKEPAKVEKKTAPKPTAKKVEPKPPAPPAAPPEPPPQPNSDVTPEEPAVDQSTVEQPPVVTEPAA